MSGTALITLDALKATDVFTEGGVQKILARIQVQVDTLRKPIQVETEEGRELSKSLAYKIARTKTGLDDLGKDYVAELKQKAGVIDADRRILRDKLDALRDDVRKPVDEWEREEEKRVGSHVNLLDGLVAMDAFPDGEPSVEEIDARIAELTPYRAHDWQEFKERADQLLTKIHAALAGRRETAVRREAERAELERLRKAEADRVEAERQERIAREQRERDERIAAEAAAQAERVAAEAAARAQRDTEQAAERAAAEQRRLEQEKADALARAERAEADAKAAADRATQAERERVAAIEEREAADAAKRQANASHRGKINRAIVAALTSTDLNLGLAEHQAKAIVIALATGKIANVTINY